MVADHIYESLQIVCTKLGIQGQCVYHNTILFTTVYNKTILIGFGFWDIVFPRIIAQGAIISFFAPKGGEYSREVTISNIAD